MSIINVAVSGPFSHGFDYLASPKNTQNKRLPTLQCGMRIKVPFRHREVIGIIIGLKTNSALALNRLLNILEVLDDTPVLNDELMQLGHWASQYYQHPIGDTLLTLLPSLLRKDHSSAAATVIYWGLTPSGETALQQGINNAPQQRRLLQQLSDSQTHDPQGMLQPQLNYDSRCKATLKRLIYKAWVWKKECSPVPETLQFPALSTFATPPYPLTAPQSDAIEKIIQASGTFQCFCLDGVTGSGKTEVYLQSIQHCLENKQQALMLVPEITLTQQLIQRFEARFPHAVAVAHSGLSNKKRLESWKAVRNGIKSILIGTRSAIFTPMPRLGIVLIDEEHDASYKQQDGLRYHARDIAVLRARNNRIPVVLGSATPSSETSYNLLQQRYQRLVLPQRIASAKPPKIRLIDMKKQAIQSGLSYALMHTIQTHLQAGNQVLLFLNRRGYAPTLLCKACQWKATCQHCEAPLVAHKRLHKLCCHHCGHQRPLIDRCPECQQQDLIYLGQGTERLEETLEARFPDYPVVRIDRDSTRRKDSLENLLNKITSGEGKILIGTQMLAKGHHFPDVTLAVIINADHGLFSTDFRAAERMSQLITQVAGRAGRAEKASEVIIQSYEAEHPVLTLLLKKGYHAFMQQCLQERQLTHMPPYSALILLRAEAQEKNLPAQLLTTIKHAGKALLVNTNNSPQINILGPIPALMEKRAGYYGWILMFQSASRRALQRLMSNLRPNIEQQPLAKKMRWSIDVDPAEIG